MFISISTTGTAERPATDLGFLLHKHPQKAQQFSTAHGVVHVFYPEADEQRCTAALLLDVDPIALVRRGRGKGRGGSPDFALSQYVNDRPYAASSLLSVALRTVFRTAMKGVCEQRPGLAEQPRPLTVRLPAVAVGGGERRAPEERSLVEQLFEPLGWQVTATPIPLDESFPSWGESRYLGVELTGTLRLAEALQQLYVLLPVLDGAKHYWVSPDEVDKLLDAGEGWLAEHPDRALIIRRYLHRRWSLANEALRRLELARLAEADDAEVEELDNAVPTEEPDSAASDSLAQDNASPAEGPEEPAAGADRPVPLAQQRRESILELLRASGAARVLDLGCGQGELVAALLKEKQVTEVLGVDVSAGALAAASRKLRLARMTERQASRVRLVQGALTYTDARLKGYDAAVLCEVIEHLDLPRLPALEHAVFGAARPGTVIVTTPNAEYNVRWETLPAGEHRHADHRFEWDRAEFRQWAERVAANYGYTVALRPVGPQDQEVGSPTQLALFRIGTTQGTGPAATTAAAEPATPGAAAEPATPGAAAGPAATVAAAGPAATTTAAAFAGSTDHTERSETR
ncbi:3' terminal RNA ribose 2'-O-methyltransferase Hen1 [Streptomyces tateyamensis]|uniref:Small RNA 2'-O-methyltransferase n=1 Tax=Streptomyces tateyamensis TaxID=565073 RepID=A0A2V4ND16_9ACTN|nr:3' terminal RNA ribose 2'-O-methyltransferase Hen1 [Streptomyces tateyamensis]PYC77043.1 3' terminal RNA ribose 2'-O-methyltransferase Hen1 [Streptomyces tateyamensis]